MAKRKQKKVIERVKSRKEVRKDKRLQKKANRVHFQKRKKELKLEFKQRLKEKTAGSGKKGKNGSAQKLNTESKEKDFLDENGIKGNYNEVTEDNDEEIESDFELSDEEMENKTKSVSRQSRPAPKQPPTQLELDHQRLLKQEKLLRKDMGKQRVHQLKSANEDEDKTIRKLEKLLKIDKTKSKKNVPRMFNDGLDYALEMCLPENIEKMYAAAKEAADVDQNSDSEWQEDFALATGEIESEQKSKSKKIVNSNAIGESVTNSKAIEQKKAARLRKVETKYFGASDDELASDLSDVDSEFENESSIVDEENQSFHDENSKSGTDFSDSDVDEVDINESDGNSDDDEGPEEQNTVTKSSKKRKLEKLELLKHQLQPKSTKTAKIQAKNDNSESDDGTANGEFNDFDEFENDFDTESENSSEDEKSTGKNQKQKSKSSESHANDEIDTSDSNSNVETNVESDQEEIWEDIYGRTRDKDGNVIATDQASSNAKLTGKYVPPHLRARLAENETKVNNDGNNEMDPKRKEKLLRLKKLLKGHMNRLSEANMHKIATDIDNLYMQNSRHDMNSTLSTVICDALISNALAPERMVMEHALLVAALHANVGTEVGAHLLERLIDRFNGMLSNGINQYEVDDKTLDNLVFVLCHMYTFRIFQHNLIYEILNKLIETFCEKSIECLLLALRSVGFALRKDDPLALKELILNIQKKTSEAPAELKANPRLKYMLDILLAIKNNNVNKIPNYDPTLAEHLRKILKSLCVNGKYVTSLNITLDDLLNVQKRGKWWVVGSAWTGNISDIGGAFKSNSMRKDEQKFSEQLLQLARKQRMNTDERRNAFCVLMSAEDYIDAFEKLLHLAIKDHRVIVSVIIHCCLSEKAFNPYYAVVMQKFCEFDRKYQLAVQFAVWDRIKDITSQTSIQSKNLAQFLMFLITSAALPLSVLKVIEFGELEKNTLRLVRQILLGILLGKEETCKEIFQRIAPSAKLKAFKDSIRLFMHHFLLKGGAKNGIPEDKMDLLKERIQMADKSLDTTTIRF